MSSFPQPSQQRLAWHFLAGGAGLCISANDFVAGEPPCAAEAAVVLDLAGELLDALAAAGLVTDAAWQWVAQPAGGAGAHALWRSADAETRLTLPWTTLRALRQDPELPGVQWQPTPAECVLAQWWLSDEELAIIEPGGLMLLEGEVSPRLRARGEASAGEAPWQLVARWEMPLAAELVMGWRGPAPAMPVTCQLVEAARPDTVRARGRLVPWSTGQAFLIEAT